MISVVDRLRSLTHIVRDISVGGANKDMDWLHTPITTQLNCILCKDYIMNWLIYFTVDLLPLTLF